MIKIIKKIILWILVVFFGAAALAFLPNFSGFLWLAFVVLILPIDKWQQLIGKFIKGKWKAAVCVLLVLCALIFTPASNSEADPSDSSTGNSTSASTQSTAAATDSTAVSIESTPASTAASTVSTAAPTTTPTAAPTSAPTTTPTTAPTTAPTTTPTTAPTTAPTTTPTTAPTTAPTTTPTTAPTTAPTTTPTTAPTTPTTTPTTAPSEDDASQYDYILNTNTKKYHHTWCDSAEKIKEENKQYYHGTAEELEQQGYTACKKCH